MTKLTGVLFAALVLGACSSGGDATPATSSGAAPSTIAPTTTVAGYVLPDDVAAKIADCVDGAIRQTENTGMTCVMAQLALRDEPLIKVNGVANALDDLTGMVVKRESGVATYPAKDVVAQAKLVESKVDALG